MIDNSPYDIEGQPIKTLSPEDRKKFLRDKHVPLINALDKYEWTNDDIEGSDKLDRIVENDPDVKKYYNPELWQEGNYGKKIMATLAAKNYLIKNIKYDLDNKNGLLGKEFYETNDYYKKNKKSYIENSYDLLFKDTYEANVPLQGKKDIENTVLQKYKQYESKRLSSIDKMNKSNKAVYDYYKENGLSPEDMYNDWREWINDNKKPDNTKYTKEEYAKWRKSIKDNAKKDKWTWDDIDKDYAEDKKEIKNSIDEKFENKKQAIKAVEQKTSGSIIDWLFTGLDAEDIKDIPEKHINNISALNEINARIKDVNFELKKRIIASSPIVTGEEIATMQGLDISTEDADKLKENSEKAKEMLNRIDNNIQPDPYYGYAFRAGQRDYNASELEYLKNAQKQLAKTIIATNESILYNRKLEGIKYVLSKAAYVPDEEVTTQHIKYSKPDTYLKAIANTKRQYGEALIGMGIIKREDLAAMANMTEHQINTYYPLYSWMMNAGTPSDDIMTGLWESIKNPGRAISPSMSQFFHNTFGVKDISDEMVELKEHYIRINKRLYNSYADSKISSTRSINPEYGVNDYLRAGIRKINPINWLVPFAQGTIGGDINPMYTPDPRFDFTWTKEFLENPNNSVLENSVVLNNAREIATFQYENGLKPESDYKYIMSTSDAEKAMGLTMTVSDLLADMSYGPYKLGAMLSSKLLKTGANAISIANNIKHRSNILGQIGKYAKSEQFTSIPQYQRLQGIADMIFRKSPITQAQAKVLQNVNNITNIPMGMVTSYILSGDPYMSPESILQTAKNGMILSGANMFFGKLFSNVAKEYTMHSKVFKDMAKTKQAPFLEKRMNNAWWVSNTFAQAVATPLQRMTSGMPVDFDWDFAQEMIINTILLGKDTKRMISDARDNYVTKINTMAKPLIEKVITPEQYKSISSRISEVTKVDDDGTITAKVEPTLLENVANKIGKDVDNITVDDIVKDKRITTRKNKRKLRNIEKINDIYKANNEEIKIVEKDLDENSAGKFIPETNTVVINSNTVDALNHAGVEYNAIDAVNDVLEHEFIHKPVNDILNNNPIKREEIKLLYDKMIINYNKNPEEFEKRLIDNGLHEWFFDTNNFGDLDIETFDTKIKDDDIALNEFAVYMLSDSDIGKRFREFVKPIYSENTIFSNWIAPIINSFKADIPNQIGNQMLSIKLDEMTPKLAADLPQDEGLVFDMTYKALLATKMFQNAPNEETFNSIQNAYRQYQAKALEYGRLDIASKNIKQYYDDFKATMTKIGITDENRLISMLPNYIMKESEKINKYTLTKEFADSEAKRIIDQVDIDNSAKQVFDVEKNTDKDIDTKIKLNMMSTQLGYKNTRQMMNDIRLKSLDENGKTVYNMMPVKDITKKLYERVISNDMYKDMDPATMKLGVTCQALKLKTYKQLPIYTTKVHIDINDNVKIDNKRNFGTKALDLRDIDIWDSNFDATAALKDNFWLDKTNYSDPSIRAKDDLLYSIFVNMRLIKMPDMEVKQEKMSKKGILYQKDLNMNKLDEKSIPIVKDELIKNNIFALPKENGSIALQINGKNIKNWELYKKPENARKFYKGTVEYSFWRWLNSDHTWQGDDMGKKIAFMRKYMSIDYILGKLNEGKFELGFQDMVEMLDGKVDDVNKKGTEYAEFANMILDKAKSYFNDGFGIMKPSDLWEKELPTNYDEAGTFLYEGINNIHNWLVNPAGTNRMYKVEGNLIDKSKYAEKYLPLLYANQPLKFSEPDDLKWFLYASNNVTKEEYLKKDYTRIFDEMKITRGDDGNYYQDYAIWNNSYFEDYLDNRIIREQMQTLNDKVGGDGAELVISEKQHKFINNMYGRTDNGINLGKPKGYWKDVKGNVIMFKGATHYHNIDEASKDIASMNPGFLHFRKFKNQVPSIISSSALKNSEATNTVIKDVPDLGIRVGMNNKGNILFTMSNGKKDFSKEAIKTVHDYIVSNWLNGKIVDLIKGKKPLTGEYAISWDVPKKPVDRISTAQIALDKMPQTYMYDGFLENNEAGANFVDALAEVSDNIVYDQINQKARAYIYVHDALISKYANKSKVPEELHNTSLNIVAEDMYNVISNMDTDMFKMYAGDKNADKEICLSLLDKMIYSDEPIKEFANLMIAIPRFVGSENNILQSRISDFVKNSLNTSVTGTQLVLQVEGASAAQVKNSPNLLISKMNKRADESQEEYDSRIKRKAAFLASRQYQIESNHIDPETGKYKAMSNAFTVPLDWLNLENKRRVGMNLPPLTLGDRILIGRVPSDSPDCVTAGIIGAVSEDNACVTGNPDFWVKHWGADMDKDGITLRTEDNYLTPKLFDTIYNYLLNSGSQFAAFRQDRNEKNKEKMMWNSRTDNEYLNNIEDSDSKYWTMLPHALGYSNDLLYRYGTQASFIGYANKKAIEYNDDYRIGIRPERDVDEVAKYSILKNDAVDYFNDYPYDLKSYTMGSDEGTKFNENTDVYDYKNVIHENDLSASRTPFMNTVNALSNIISETNVDAVNYPVHRVVQYITDSELRKSLMAKGMELSDKFKDIPGLKQDLTDMMQLTSIMKYTTEYKMNPFISYYTKDREFSAADVKFAGMIINTIDKQIPYNEPELGKNNIFDLKSGIQITNGILEYYDSRKGRVTKQIPIDEVFDDNGNVKIQYDSEGKIDESRQFSVEDIAKILKVNIGNSTKNIFDIYNWKGFRFKDFDMVNDLAVNMAYSIIDKYIPEGENSVTDKAQMLTYIAYGIPSKSAMLGGWSKGSFLSPRWSKIKGSPDKTKNELYQKNFDKMINDKYKDIGNNHKLFREYLSNNYYDISTSPNQIINKIKDKGITPIDIDGNELSTKIFDINRDNYEKNLNLVKSFYNSNVTENEITSNSKNVANKIKEVSSAGDKRFSALYAKIGNRTIEDIYQNDVKEKLGGKEYTGKGKVNPDIPYENYYKEYKNLWEIWANEHKAEMEELANDVLNNDYVLHDKYVNNQLTSVNQARALTDIINDKYNYIKNVKNTYDNTKEYNMSLLSFVSNKNTRPLDKKQMNAVTSMKKIRKQIATKYPNLVDADGNMKSISELNNQEWGLVYEDIIKPEIDKKIDLLFKGNVIDKDIKDRMVEEIDNAMGDMIGDKKYYNINGIEKFFETNTISSGLSNKFTKALAVFNVLDALQSISKSGKYGEYTNLSLINPINKREILGRTSSNYSFVPAQDVIAHEHVASNGNVLVIPKSSYTGIETEVKSIPIKAYDLSYDIMTDMPDAVVAMPKVYKEHILHHDLFLKIKDVIMDNAYRRYEEIIINNEELKSLYELENGEYDTINDLIKVDSTLSDTYSTETYSLFNMPEGLVNTISKSDNIGLPDVIDTAYPLWVEYIASMQSPDMVDYTKAQYAESVNNKEYVKGIKTKLKTAMTLKLLATEWANAYRKMELQAKEYILSNNYENDDIGVINYAIDKFKRQADRYMNMKPSDMAKELRTIDITKMQDVLTDLVGKYTEENEWTNEIETVPTGVLSKEILGEEKRKKHAKEYINNRMVEETDSKLYEKDFELGDLIPGYYNVLAFMKNRSRGKAIEGKPYTLDNDEMKQAYFVLRKHNKETIDRINEKRKENNYKLFEYATNNTLEDAVRDISNHISLVNENTGIMYKAFQKIGIPGFENDWNRLSDMEKYTKGSIARQIGKQKIEDFVVRNRMLQGDVIVRGLNNKDFDNMIDVSGKKYTYEDYSEMVSIFDILKAINPDKFNELVGYDYHSMTSRNQQELSDGISAIESFMREKYMQSPEKNGVAHNLAMTELNTMSKGKNILDNAIDINDISNILNKQNYTNVKECLFASITYDNNQYNYVDINTVNNDTQAKNINPGGYTNVYHNAQGIMIGFTKRGKNKFAVMLNPDVNNNTLYIIPLEKIKSMYTGMPYYKDKVNNSIAKNINKEVARYSKDICDFLSKNLQTAIVKKEDYTAREVKTVIGPIPTFINSVYIKNKGLIQDDMKLSTQLREIKEPILDSKIRGITVALQNLQTGGFYLPIRHAVNAVGGGVVGIAGLASNDPILTAAGFNTMLYSSSKFLGRYLRAWFGNVAMTSSNMLRHPLDKAVRSAKLNDKGELAEHKKEYLKTLNNVTFRPIYELIGYLVKENQYKSRIKKIGTDVTHGITVHTEESGIQTEIASIMDYVEGNIPRQDLKKDGRWSKHDYSDETIKEMRQSNKMINKMRLIQNRIDKTSKMLLPEWEEAARNEIYKIAGQSAKVIETIYGDIPIIGETTKSNIKMHPGKYFYAELFNKMGSLNGKLQEMEALSATKSQILIENYLQSNFDYVREFLKRSGYDPTADISQPMMYNRRMNQLWKSIGNYVKTAGNSTALGKQLTMFARFNHNGIMDQTRYLAARKQLWDILNEEIKNDKVLQKSLEVTGIPYGDNILEKWNKELGRNTLRAATFALLFGSLGTAAISMARNIFEPDDDDTLSLIKGKSVDKTMDMFSNVLDVPFGVYYDITNTMIELGSLVFTDDKREKKSLTNKITGNVSGILPTGVLETEILGIAIPNIILEMKKEIDYIRHVKYKDKKENEELQKDMVLISIFNQIQGLPVIDIAKEYTEIKKKLDNK